MQQRRTIQVGDEGTGDVGGPRWVYLVPVAARLKAFVSRRLRFSFWFFSVSNGNQFVIFGLYATMWKQG